MPILVNDFTWTQTEKAIHIRIPQKDVNREKVDLFTTDSYIKVHFIPYLFEVFLLHDVDNDKSICIVKDDLITLDLRKRDQIEWERLDKEMTKPEKMKFRQEILEKCQEKAKQESEDKRVRKSQLDRFTVQQAMAIDTEQHKTMDSRRDLERKNAMEALEEWRVNTTNRNTNIHDVKTIKDNPEYISDNIAEFGDNGNRGVKIVELPSSDDERKSTVEVSSAIKHNNLHGNGDQTEMKIVELPPSENEYNVSLASKSKYSNGKADGAGVKIIELPSDDKQKSKAKVIPAAKPMKNSARKPVKTPIRSEYVEKKKEEAAKRVLPRCRNAAQLEITHTPRTFPTPSRESTADEENAWLKNITLARRATGFVSEDLRPEEQDPQWCKEKGDEFFRNGNFLGAVSAYSHGITLSDKLPSLYANRSATHFALGNFNKCVQDCSSAVDLMKPACEGNRRSRAKCIARRGAALARLGHMSKGIDEMKAAAKMLPEDDTIKKDIFDMERAWEQNPDSD